MKADARLSLRWLVMGSMALDFLVLLGMWAGFTFAMPGPMAWVGMIWFEVEFVLCSLWLWGMATQLMDLRQGKRLFGYISAGEPLAIILGGLATPFALRFVATKDLLLFSAAGVLVAICLVLYITTRYSLQRDTAEQLPSEAPERHAARPLLMFWRGELLSERVRMDQVAMMISGNLSQTKNTMLTTSIV